MILDSARKLLEALKHDWSSGDYDLSLYTLVAEEIQRGDIHKGLWLKCLSESNSDEGQAKAAYTKYRIAFLHKAMLDAQGAAIELGKKTDELKKLEVELSSKRSEYDALAAALPRQRATIDRFDSKKKQQISDLEKRIEERNRFENSLRQCESEIIQNKSYFNYLFGASCLFCGAGMFLFLDIAEPQPYLMAIFVSAIFSGILWATTIYDGGLKLEKIKLMAELRRCDADVKFLESEVKNLKEASKQWGNMQQRIAVLKNELDALETMARGLAAAAEQLQREILGKCSVWAMGS